MLKDKECKLGPKNWRIKHAVIKKNIFNTKIVYQENGSMYCCGNIDISKWYLTAMYLVIIIKGNIDSAFFFLFFL